MKKCVSIILTGGGIEVHYRHLKSNLELENFSANTVESILQDYYVAQTHCNLEYAIAEISNEQIRNNEIKLQEENAKKAEIERLEALKIKEERDLEAKRRQEAMNRIKEDEKEVNNINNTDAKEQKRFDIGKPIISKNLEQFIVLNNGGCNLLGITKNDDIENISATNLINEKKEEALVRKAINSPPIDDILSSKSKPMNEYQANMNIINGEFRLSLFDLIKYGSEITELVVENLVATGVREKVIKSNGSVSNERNMKKKGINKHSTNHRRSA